MLPLHLRPLSNADKENRIDTTDKAEILTVRIYRQEKLTVRRETKAQQNHRNRRRGR